MGGTCSALDHYTILSYLLKLILKPYYITKSPTKAPIALSIYLAGPLFDFLISIFEFSEAARGWQPQKIDLRDSEGNFWLPASCSLRKLKNLGRKQKVVTLNNRKGNKYSLVLPSLNNFLANPLDLD